MSGFIDAETRRRAATEFNTNLVVEAGAGTGKTSLLVERLLNLILSETVPLSAIVAITFTEKAAAEMRERVASALEDLADGRTLNPHHESGRAAAWLCARAKVSEAELARRAALALEGLDRASISTIHSFCADLLRRHPVEAGIPPDFELGNRAELRAAFESVWAEYVTEQHARRTTLDPAWEAVLAITDMNELETKIALQVALQPAVCDSLARDGYVPVDLVQDQRMRIRTMRQQVEEVVTGQELPAFKGQVDATLKLLRIAEAEGAAALRVAAADPRITVHLDKKLGTPGKGVDESLHPRIKRIVERGKKLALSLADTDETQFEDLAQILQPFCRTFRARTLERGLLSFDDLLLLTRNVLRDFPEVCATESARIGALLLDEFQDTDPLQYEIVFLLTHVTHKATDADPPQTDLFAGSGSGNSTHTLPERLFIVGDPKQSIYRFRGADMTAYTRAVTRILDGASPLQLQTNFRSVSPVIHAVNALFSGWMGEEEDPEVEPDYVPIAAREEHPDPGPRVEIISVAADSEAKRDEVRVRESHAVVREIIRLKQSGVAYQEMAILLRAMTQVQIYLRALRDANIPYVVDGGKAFSQRQEVVECLGMLRAMANPGDPVGALAALRSSFGGVSDSDLARYARDGGDFRWMHAHERETRHPDVERVFTLLRTMERTTRHLPVDRRIVLMLTQGAFFMAQAAYADGPQRTANVRKLADRAADLAREHGAPMEQVIQALEEEFLPELAEGESPLADEALDAVRVLTAHRAKGLEYRHVLLPDVPGQDHHPDNEIRVRGVTTAGGFRVGLKAGKRFNRAWAFAGEEDKRHQNAESRRLLYVALTRAKERITVFFGPNTRGGSAVWHLGLKRWGYDPTAGGDQADLLADGLVTHRADDGEPSPPSVRTEQPSRALERAQAFQSARKAAAVERPLTHRTPSTGKVREVAAEVREDEPLGQGLRPELARAVGNTVHRTLEAWDFVTVESLLALMEGAARRESTGDLAPLDAVMAESRAILEPLARSPLAARLSQAEILGREVPLLFRDAQGVVVHGYADLVYRLQGRVHVADYKTDRLDAARAATQYQAQLADYGVAVQQALGLSEPPIREILLLRTAERVVLD